MGRKPKVLDQYGRPVKRAELTQEVAAATVGGARSPVFGYPADGLDPVVLASILRAADHGDPTRYMGLAETIEERDPHYLAVLGTRKRAVSQLEITVEPGADTPDAKKHAELIRAWLKRDELTEEIFNILDAIGKGYSFMEIIWDYSEGQYQPERLEWRDQRWFRFDRTDLRTPLLLDDKGREVPLSPFKFIFAPMPAKSGLYLRSGLARIATWSWMFKAYTQRDWSIFTQTFGQPIRIGKYAPGTSDAEKNTLFRAVADIAGDCAAIMPASMSVDIVAAPNVGASSDLYEKRADWLDKQTSKAVLGQTSTTDAVTGGLGSGKEHREVQEDIERADGRMLAAILNRQLVRPFIDLNHGPQKVYPRLVIARPEAEDLKAWTDATVPWVSAGLQVSQKEVLDKLGLSAPKAKDAILGKTPETPPQPGMQPGAGNGNTPESIFKGGFYTRNGFSGGDTALQAEQPSAGDFSGVSPIPDLTARLEQEAGPAVDGMLDQIEAMLEAASGFEEFREILLNAYSDLNADGLTASMLDAITAAVAGGRAAVEDEAGD
ncbi:DUF935 domain-containing protein [Leisingera methylohalidivorans]|uniref:Portal protein n=1 Tax=Leisingera methylohalidivorans DSM 14336 TaxID=999552 RepID=V9VTY9_9RHOB|nr:DUF935 domain-containing protein [Leisingera methylohalidivorans]AHD01184.1 hypothetical protein METH_11295 [Leisingera methylohalidivorans DSM 14336]